MKYINLILIGCILTGCNSKEIQLVTETVKPPEILSKWKVVLKEDFIKAESLTNLPSYIYIVPPIRINVSGEPQESFDIQTGIDGKKYCVTTNLFAAKLQKTLSNVIKRNASVSVISYDDFLNLSHRDDVASLSSYYSEPIYPPSNENTSSSRVEMVYFNTEIFSLEPSQDFKNRKILAFQKLFLRYHSDIEWTYAISKVFTYLGYNLGSESRHIKEIYWSDLEVE